jgi:hypothetical protein
MIELVITVGISMLLIGGIVVSYNSFNDTQVLKQAGLTLKNNLRFAQVKATSAEKPESGCTQLVGYTVTFTVSSYETQAECTEGLVGPAATVVLPSGVTFSPIPASVTFAALTHTLVSGATVTVTLAGRSNTYILLISANGEVTDVGIQ